MGIIRKGPLFYFLKFIAQYQYYFADVIGVQTGGNEKYFKQWHANGGDRRIEVLENWLTKAPYKKASISISKTHIANRKIFIYAGNMGVAQNAMLFLELANLLKLNVNIGFIFVGRGSEKKKFKSYAEVNKLYNVIFCDEITPEEMPDLFSQCHIGLVALDPRHKSHNIPGKFIAYMQSGLPILGLVNEGNDMVQLVRQNKVGKISTSRKIDDLYELAISALGMLSEDPSCVLRCKKLAEQLYGTEKAATQILSALRE
jgi:glycosyltransferase involved in cell wall biosynthesis